MSGLFGDTPEPPQAPPPPPSTPTIDDARDRQRNADLLRRRRGYAATVLSSDQKTNEQPTPGRSVVLGGVPR